jgi:hypothetical protein
MMNNSLIEELCIFSPENTKPLLTKEYETEPETATDRDKARNTKGKGERERERERERKKEREVFEGEAAIFCLLHILPFSQRACLNNTYSNICIPTIRGTEERARLVEVGGRTTGKELAGDLGVRGTEDTVGKRELDGAVVELLGGGADAILGGKLLNIEDLDGGETSTVTAGHILVQSSHGGSTGGLTELLVHVVGGATAVVSEPDSVVLDLVVTLNNLVEGDDLTVDLLELLQGAHEVPETGAGNDGVLGEQTHTVDGGAGLGLSGLSATDNEVLLVLQFAKKITTNTYTQIYIRTMHALFTAKKKGRGHGCAIQRASPTHGLGSKLVLKIQKSIHWTRNCWCEVLGGNNLVRVEGRWRRLFGAGSVMCIMIIPQYRTFLCQMLQKEE